MWLSIVTIAEKQDTSSQKDSSLVQNVDIIIMQNENQLVCKLCNLEFEHLGSHIFHGHQMTARAYKTKFGLDYKMALISDAVKKKKQIAFERTRDIAISNLTKNGKKYRFKPGHTNLQRISQQTKTRLAKQSKEVQEKQHGLCPVCNIGYDHVDSHLYNAHGLKKAEK